MINAILSLFGGATTAPQESAPPTGFDAALRALIPGLPIGESEAASDNGRPATSPEDPGKPGPLGVGPHLVIAVADTDGDGDGDGDGKSPTGASRPGTGTPATSPESAAIEGEARVTPTAAPGAGSAGTRGRTDEQGNTPVAGTPGTPLGSRAAAEVKTADASPAATADGDRGIAPGQAGPTGPEPQPAAGASDASPTEPEADRLETDRLETDRPETGRPETDRPETDRPETGRLDTGAADRGAPTMDPADAWRGETAKDRTNPVFSGARPANGPGAPAGARRDAGSGAAVPTGADGSRYAAPADTRGASNTPQGRTDAGPAAAVWTGSAVADVEVTGAPGGGLDDGGPRTGGAIAGVDPKAVPGEPDARWARAAASTLDRMRGASPARTNGAEVSGKQPAPEGQATTADPGASDTVARDLRTAQREALAHDRAARAPTTDPGKGEAAGAVRNAGRRARNGGEAKDTDRPAVDKPSHPRPDVPTATAAGTRAGSGYDAGAIRAADPVQGPDTAGRVESIDALREQEARQPLKRVSVRVGEGESAARVRVSVRGDAVQAEMATESERLATRIGRELPELKQSIQRQGLEPDALRVRHGDRMVAAEVAAPRSGGSARSGGGGQEQQQSSHRSGSHPDAHEGRDRSRDHHNEEGNE